MLAFSINTISVTCVYRGGEYLWWRKISYVRISWWWVSLVEENQLRAYIVVVSIFGGGKSKKTLNVLQVIDKLYHTKLYRAESVGLCKLNEAGKQIKRVTPLIMKMFVDSKNGQTASIIDDTPVDYILTSSYERSRPN